MALRLRKIAARCYVSLYMSANPILQGIVRFRAQVDPRKGVTFASFEFNPNQPGVDKVEIEAANDTEIITVVHLSGLGSEEDGIAIAHSVHAAALDRICFLHDLAIDNGRITSQNFIPMNSQAGVTITPGTAILEWNAMPPKVSRSLSSSKLKGELENAALPGERNFRLFRSALRSISPVEEFMHLYNILLMLFDDKQAKVDGFILRENPQVPMTPDPRPKQKKNETVYTRLRNELGHKREDVNLDDTKAEMLQRLPELIAITKRAIELRS